MSDDDTSETMTNSADTSGDAEPATPTRRSFPWKWTVVGVVAVVVVAVGFDMALGGKRPLEDAAEACGQRLSVADDGRSISLHVPGEDSDIDITTIATLESAVCVLTELEAPSYVVRHIESTRALDGQQTDAWEKFEARWTYHPDPGLQITIREPRG